MNVEFPYGKQRLSYEFGTELKQMLSRARVIYVSDLEDALVRKLHMIPAHSIGEALAQAKGLLGKEAVTVTAIPDGIGVVVNVK